MNKEEFISIQSMVKTLTDLNKSLSHLRTQPKSNFRDAIILQIEQRLENPSIVWETQPDSATPGKSHGGYQTPPDDDIPF